MSFDSKADFAQALDKAKQKEDILPKLQEGYITLSQHQLMVDGTLQFLLQRVDQLTQIVQDLQKEQESGKSSN